MAFPTGWGRKCVITVPDAQILGSNTNFPVLVTEDNFPTEMMDGGTNSALNGGGDVRFSEDSAGLTQLPCDVVSFVTGGTPSAEIHVKLPTLNTGADKTFYVWYKKAAETQPAVTDPYGRNAVWDGAQVVVLMESVTPVDRTGNHTLSLTGTLVSVAGPFGNANEFGASDRLSNTDAALRDILTTYDTTISIVSRKNAFVSNRAALSFDGTDDFIMYPMEDDGAPTLGVRVFWRDIPDINTMYINNVAAIDTWGWMSFTTRASNDHELYQNGVSGITKTGTGTVGPFSTFFIGGWTTQNWYGDIAQVVVWKTARTSTWITTEYNNQSDRAAFATAGTPEDAGGSGTIAAITGVIATGFAGTLATQSDANIPLVGVSGAGVAGTLTVSASQTVVLTGLSAAAAAGSVVALSSPTIVLAGVESTGQAGLLSVISGTSITITGVTSTGSVGSLSFQSDSSVTLSGISAIGQIGTVVIPQDGSTTLEGVGTTGVAGILTVSLSGEWTIQPAAGGSWTIQPESDDTWTEQAESSDTWTIQ